MRYSNGDKVIVTRLGIAGSFPATIKGFFGYVSWPSNYIVEWTGVHPPGLFWDCSVIIETCIDPAPVAVANTALAAAGSEIYTGIV